MHLSTVVRDCLYLNWALPREGLPELPEPLEYEGHLTPEGERVMASALLFRQSEVRWSALRHPRLAFPQFNLRVYVQDEEGMPSVLFLALRMPAWVVPLARLAGQPGVGSAHLRYPRLSTEVEEERWRWRVAAEGTLEVEAWQAAPQVHGEPDFGSWNATCDAIRRRDRGYLMSGGALRRIETAHTSTAIWPVAVEIGRSDLLPRLLGVSLPWPDVHSAWICPEMPLRFELAGAVAEAIPPGVPAPS